MPKVASFSPPGRLTEQQALQAAIDFHKKGQLKEAKDLYRLILSHNPRNAEAMHRMGTMALQVEQFEKAEEYIGMALDFGPATSAMFINYGTALRNLERFDEAIAAFDSAISLSPESPDAYYNKGRALISAGRFEDAIFANQHAIELNPSDAEAWSNLGAAQKSKGLHLQSLYSFDRALQINPNIASTVRNIGVNLLEMRLTESAIQMFRRSHEIDPIDISSRYHLHTRLLAIGKLAEGWDDFGVRFDKFDEARAQIRKAPPRYWDGSDFQGKHALLWGEQGIGEHILMATVLPEFLAEIGTCTFECLERMVPILSRSFPDVTFVPRDEHSSLVEKSGDLFDFQYPAYDLLAIYRRSFSDFPKRRSVIKPDMDRRNQLRERYEKMANGRRIVGISWQSTSLKLQSAKSAKLAEWHVIIESPDLFVVNLQYGDYAEEVAEYKQRYPCSMYDDPEVDPIANLEDALAQIAAMDLVISVSNSNVHMAGGMGVPAWLILPNTTEILWFWFLDRRDSPWYPSVRIFRQRTFLDEEGPWWRGVLGEVSEALQGWLSEPLTPPSVS